MIMTKIDQIHCSKYLKEHLIIFIGDSVIPRPIAKACISLDNKAEIQFLFAILAKIAKVLDQKKFITKHSVFKLMAQIL